MFPTAHQKIAFFGVSIKPAVHVYWSSSVKQFLNDVFESNMLSRAISVDNNQMQNPILPKSIGTIIVNGPVQINYPDKNNKINHLVKLEHKSEDIEAQILSSLTNKVKVLDL